MSVNKLLVAGAGQMGAGIAQVSAAAGLDVVMIDVADEFIARGMAGIEKGLGRLVEKGRMEADARDAALARITTSTDMAAGADADLFIEAAPGVDGAQARSLREGERDAASRRHHRQQHVEPVDQQAGRVRHGARRVSWASTSSIPCR